jgi:hypothetical protein
MHAMERMADQVTGLIRTLPDVVAVRSDAQMKCLSAKGLVLHRLRAGTPIGRALSLTGKRLPVRLAAKSCHLPDKRVKRRKLR